jgi:hypothetical protein
MRTSVLLVAAVVVASPVYAQQAPQPEFRSFAYARLGYGAAFADRVGSAPAMGLGYRGEFKTHALDISFLNFTIDSDSYDGGQVFAGSSLKLQVLRFLNPEAERSMYVGGGLSWGHVSVGRDSSFGSYTPGWHGSGLQGEFSTGYEFRGNTPLRVFLQADIGVPFFRAYSDAYGYRVGTTFVPAARDQRFIPSAAVSFGMGWDARKRRR